MRKAFTLPFAIFILFIMATLGVYSLYVSSQTIKVVADEDVSKQLKIYVDSATEINLLWLSADSSRSQEGKDLNISFENGAYKFEIYNHATNQKDTIESNGTVIMDIIGTTTITGESIRVTKRLVKKP